MSSNITEDNKIKTKDGGDALVTNNTSEQAVTPNVTEKDSATHVKSQPAMVLVRRDCDAVLVPTGVEIELKKGTEVLLLQSKGSFTLNVYGNMVRVANQDADALGLEPLPMPKIPEDETLENKVTALLKTCYDPEIPVNIYDLGLIYHVDISPLSKFEHHVKITMTLTAPGCGMGPILLEDVKAACSQLKEFSSVEVDLVFDPPWERAMMSPEAQLTLGVF